MITEAVTPESSVCDLCKHPMKDNNHGPDQNDFIMDGDKLVHLGVCTYCIYCNPALMRIVQGKVQ